MTGIPEFFNVARTAFIKVNADGSASVIYPENVVITQTMSEADKEREMIAY